MSYKNKKRNIRFFYSNGPSNFPLTNILHNCSNMGSNIFHKGIKFKNIPVYSLVFSSKNIDYRPPCLIHIDKNTFARYDGNIKKDQYTLFFKCSKQNCEKIISNVKLQEFFNDYQQKEFNNIKNANEKINEFQKKDLELNDSLSEFLEN